MYIYLSLSLYIYIYIHIHIILVLHRPAGDVHALAARQRLRGEAAGSVFQLEIIMCTHVCMYVRMYVYMYTFMLLS